MSEITAIGIISAQIFIFLDKVRPALQIAFLSYGHLMRALLKVSANPTFSVLSTQLQKGKRYSNA